MKICNNISELVGNTPLVFLNNFSKKYSLENPIMAKLEYFNPAGSVKDRVGNAMIFNAEKEGLLKKGGCIIEPTSGNTGIGLSAVAASKGYRVILTMPDTMSIERRKLLSAYGAEVVLTDGKEGMTGAIKKAKELLNEIEGSYMPGQFENKINPQVHYETTGPEIWDALSGKIDAFVAGIGTGGTISGVGKFLKEQNPHIKIIGIEPSASPFITEGKSGPHKLQGIGAGFIPDTLSLNVVDEVLKIDWEPSYEAARLLAKTEGYLVGITSGAALYGATLIAKKYGYKNIVALLPDTGERYLSSDLF